jgi:hypothetical protein
LITLVSAEKEKFAVPAHIAFGSGLVRAQVGDMGDLAEVSEKVLSLDLVESKVLAKVIEFMGHHAVHKLPTIEKPLKSCEVRVGGCRLFVLARAPPYPRTRTHASRSSRTLCPSGTPTLWAGWKRSSCLT